MVSKVDHNAIKFNQVSIALVSLGAFIGDWPLLAGVLGLIVAVGTASPSWGLFRFVYQRAALPLGLLRPHVVDDDPAPHRFAQGVGAAVLILGYAALLSGAAAVGWTLVVLVTVLALVNVVFDFCAGCYVYYQLRRVGVIRQPSGGTSGR
ncbi:MAG TPA: DUF4395 domain-containing protein [bacterium]|nr:DUF4395 domain-containing protein [bacterium]